MGLHYQQKYGVRDYRGGGRSSARETAMRVAAGAIAKVVNLRYGIAIRGYLSQLGPLTAQHHDWRLLKQILFLWRRALIPKLESYMQALIKAATLLVLA